MGVEPDQDTLNKIKKRNATNAASPTQKAMTIESVERKNNIDMMWLILNLNI